jgi:hypothetical protein
LFEVVAVDERDGTVEMQHFDGTLEESEPEGWVAMRPETTAAPEDWSGSVDVTEEDLPDSTQPLFLDWQSQLDLLDNADLQDESD